MAKVVSRVTLCAWAVVAAAGCGRLRSELREHTDGQGGPASPGSNPTPWAANGGEVSRFADEVPFGPDATIAHVKTPVRPAPGAGVPFAMLSTGTDVVKIAQRGTDELIFFEDPADSSRHLLGWVPESALQEPSAPTPTPSSAPTPVPSTMPSANADADVPPPPPMPPAPAPGPDSKHHHRPKGGPHQPHPSPSPQQQEAP